TGARDRTAPVNVSVGGDDDDLHVVRFHARERHTNGSRYRWSTGQSFVVLPHVPVDARALTITMSSGGRPETALAPDVEVALDDEVLGTVSVVETPEPYVFALPPDLVARLAAD